ncbi:hypothetical protein [Rhodohalobacter sp.]|uniref:hypothetical protein n=1 Tax=Rhodohalobacter sp. TaxID=1974210 RepID=UPI002ACE9A50|nr:hypothetical protein [Rhodohalobacter sp.]MDZ7756857.1 hypothetical protein [Rhodohalobacter sp.]
MKYLFLLVLTGLLLTNCTSTETVTTDRDIEAEEQVDKDRFAPEWYNEEKKSATDSLSFSGYSYAIAEGEDRAREQSERTALANLRFEIDRFVESVRVELEEENGSDPFGSQQLIMNVRNAVRNLDLSETELEYDIQKEDGFHHVFTKAVISREEVVDMLTKAISNSTLSASLEDQQVL